jgi:hypothetical protein
MMSCGRHLSSQNEWFCPVTAFYGFIIQLSLSIVNIFMHEKQTFKKAGHAASAVILLPPHGPYMTRLHFCGHNFTATSDFSASFPIDWAFFS